jgi:hypothetical protein
LRSLLGSIDADSNGYLSFLEYACHIFNKSWHQLIYAPPVSLAEASAIERLQAQKEDSLLELLLRPLWVVRCLGEGPPSPPPPLTAEQEAEEREINASALAIRLSREAQRNQARADAARRRRSIRTTKSPSPVLHIVVMLVMMAAMVSCCACMISSAHRIRQRAPAGVLASTIGSMKHSKSSSSIQSPIYQQLDWYQIMACCVDKSLKQPMGNAKNPTAEPCPPSTCHLVSTDTLVQLKQISLLPSDLNWREHVRQSEMADTKRQDDDTHSQSRRTA